MLMRLLCVVFPLVVGCSSEEASQSGPSGAGDSGRHPDLAEAVQQLAQQCCDATVTGNYEAVADLTFPKIIEMIGGREKMVEAMRSDLSRSDSPKLVAMVAGTPLPIGEFPGYKFTFVPTATTVSFGSRALRRQTHMLALSADDGVTWHFISGNKQSHDRIRALVPEFPSTIELPTNKPPEVVRE